MPTGLSSTSGLFPYSKITKPLDAATVAAIQDALEKACKPPPAISFGASTRARLGRIFDELRHELLAQQKWRPAQEVNAELRSILAASEKLHALLKNATPEAHFFLHGAMRSNEPERLIAVPGLIADAAKMAIAGCQFITTRGRNSPFEPYAAFIVHLADIFSEYSGKRATSCSNRKTGRLGGPFVTFVGAVLALVPNIPKELSIPAPYLGSVIKTALARRP